MSIPIYKINFNGEDGQGIYGISLVKRPANNFNYVALSGEEVKLKVENREKKIVTGVVLVPNQLILRYDKKYGEHYITFDEENIERLSQAIFSTNANVNSWYEHNKNTPLTDNIIVESWIINSESQDKAFSLGFKDLPKGTWMVSMKLSDKDWVEFVKTGVTQGFSIDAYLKKELQLTKIKKDSMSVLTRLFKRDKSASLIKMATMDFEGKELIAEAFEEGKKVSYLDEEGNEVAYKSASFVSEGKVYTTDEEGVIISIIDESVQEEEFSQEDVEAFKAQIREAIEEDEDFKKALLEVADEYKVVEEVKIEDEEIILSALSLAKKDDKTKQRFSELFKEEKEAYEVKMTKLEQLLAKKPNTTKLSAVVPQVVNDRPETKMEAISRIAKKSK